MTASALAMLALVAMIADPLPEAQSVSLRQLP